MIIRKAATAMLTASLVAVPAGLEAKEPPSTADNLPRIAIEDLKTMDVGHSLDLQAPEYVYKEPEPSPTPTPTHTPPPKPVPVPQPPKQLQSSVRVVGYSDEQCVVWFQRVTGNYKVRGYAGDVKPEGYEPRVGAAALEAKYGHVSLVIAIQGDYLVLRDANYIKGAVTERTVHKSTQRGYVY